MLFDFLSFGSAYAFSSFSGNVARIGPSESTGGRFSNPAKNLGATINGSLNSVESETGQ